MTDAGFAPHPPITISTAATQASQPAVALAIAAQLVRTYGPDARTVAMRISAAIAEMEARP